MQWYINVFRKEVHCMKMSTIICFSLLIVSIVHIGISSPVCRVIRVYPRNEYDVQLLQEFQNENKKSVKFWREPSRSFRPVDVMVPKSLSDDFKTNCQTQGITFHPLIADVQELIDEQMSKMAGRNPPTNLADFDYSVYHTYDEIRQWVIDMAAEHADIVEDFLVTHSYEGREIRGITISVDSGASKKSIWYEGGIHAREWISPATLLYIANQLITNYKAGDQRVVRILENWDFFIIPSINVDGYAFTWSSDRLWRKTRKPNPEFGCVGTDGNRNFPYMWGVGDGASPWPCNNVYSGEYPLSEIEVKGLTDYAWARTKEQEIRISIDWHNYDQLWLIPWSYDEAAELPPEFPDMLEAANVAVEAQKQETGTEYSAGASAKLLYEFSGGSNDWGFAMLGAKYSYVIELRDQGQYGFLLPEDQIVPCGRENYAGTLALAEYVLDNDF